MSNSMFFLPCICIIICFIISAITYTYNKAKDRAFDKAINDDIQDGFVCLGDVYIDKYSIESIYLDDNGHLVNIKTDRFNDYVKENLTTGEKYNLHNINYCLSMNAFFIEH